MDNFDINTAGQMVKDAEVAALNSVQTLLDSMDADLNAIAETLPAVISMDARRIISDVRNALSYQRTTMIPMILSKYNPAPEAPVYTPPTQA